jgi:glycosyltransferase involved in cell wall biosynthesis
VRILAVQETDYLRRGPHQQHHLLERLAGRGHVVTVLDYPILRQHWPREPLWASRQTWGGVRRVDGPGAVTVIRPGTLGLRPLARPSSLVTFYAELHRQVSAARPDLLISYALSTGLPTLAIARQYGLPYVFHVIDVLHTIVPLGALRPIARRVERRMLRTADLVVLINEHLRDYAVQIGADPSRCRVVRTGVDLRRQSEEARDQARADLGLGPGDVALFFMGWLYDFARLETVAALLPELPPQVRLVVAGDGDAFEALQALRDGGLGKRLILTGRVPFERIPALLAAADVCLLPFECNPATEYIVPIKIYEYMAANRPTLANQLPGLMRDVPPGNGVVYAPPHDWAAHICELLDPARRAELGGRARAFVEAHCDWERLTDSFEALLAEQVT